MDTTLDNVAYSLFNGQLPAIWRKLAPDTCKNLGGWMDHFQSRNRQYSKWVSNTLKWIFIIIIIIIIIYCYC